VKKIFILISLIFFLGCASNTIVYVPHGDAVKLRETVKNVKVWIKTKDGEIVPGVMDLPNGWFCLPYEEKAKNPTTQ